MLTPSRAFAADVPETLVPRGNVVGITASIDGAMVVGTEKNSAAEEAGLKSGDIITEIDHMEIATGSDISRNLQECDGDVTLTVDRRGKSMELTVTPEDGKMGVWLRDGIDGIGTVTYYDPETESFGALGHSITDCDTGVMLPLRDGNVTDVQLTEVMIGKQGTPGQLQGMPIFDTVYGEVSENTKNGIFGTMTTDDITSGRESYPVATESEIKTGDAVILSDAIDGEMREYTIEISRMFTGFVTDGKDMLVTITDERLLDATGGIVQGMSGSPIIQDGKLVGAVTHVLINDPAKGYGIFIENMLDAA